MSELRECPFCGGEPRMQSTSFQDKHMYWSQCLDPDCIMSDAGSTWPTKSAAIAAWNRRASGWRPIETAPKDGTWVLLLWAGESTPIVAHWCTSGWDDGDYRSFMQDNQFTHWMPLPDPPTTPPPAGEEE